MDEVEGEVEDEAEGGREEGEEEEEKDLKKGSWRCGRDSHEMDQADGGLRMLFSYL